MNKPFFSIITICLNAGNLLSKTIDSILIQNFIDFEIIVKDGGSTDGAISQLQKDPRLNVYIKNDKGIYDAMNQALTYARGKYILFLNASDYFYDSSILQTFYNCIIKNQNPSLVYCDFTRTNLNEYVQSPLKLSKFFLYRHNLCHQACMIKKDCYIKFGNFDINLKVCADHDFMLRILLLGHVNYKHIQKLGIISTSYGFSSQNNALGLQESNFLKKKYFKKMFLFYTTIYFLTFPILRKKIVESDGIFSVIYQRLVNFVNHYM